MKTTFIKTLFIVFIVLFITSFLAGGFFVSVFRISAEESGEFQIDSSDDSIATDAQLLTEPQSIENAEEDDESVSENADEFSLQSDGPILDTMMDSSITSAELTATSSVSDAASSEAAEEQSISGEIASSSVDNPIWKINDDGSATAAQDVNVGLIYYYPKNEDVSIKFTLLPEISGTITIREIKLSREEQEMLGALSDTAYDITSTMEDGTFAYDLTLPLPQNANNLDVKVKYAEAQGELFKDIGAEYPDEQTQNNITIKDLNHFTIFVVTTDVSPLTDPTCTWTGGGADTNWMTAANWDGGTAPVVGDSIVFDSTGVETRPSPNNNFPAGTSFEKITVSASGYTIGGNSVSLTSGLVVDTYTSGTSTVSLIVGGAGSVTMSATGVLILSGANTFTGGTLIKSGTAVANVSNATTVSGAFGPSGYAITLGDSAGASANLLANSFTVSNPINLGSSAVGTITIGNNVGATAAIFSGAIGLNGINLTISPSGTGSATIKGGITGIGNVTVNNNTTTAVTTISTAAVNNIGTITNSGGGTGLTTISGGIGSNVTAVTENSTTSALTVSTMALTVNSGGTTLTNVAGTKILTISGGVTGTGDLILNNNSTLANGITLSTTAINNTGTITNSGSGSGLTLINAGLGAAVTGVTQNSNTSSLTLSGVNTNYAGVTTLASGILKLGSATALGGNGSTTGTGGALNITVGTTLDASVATALTTMNAENWNGNFTFGGSFTLNTGTGAVTLGASSIQVSKSGASLLTVGGGVTGTSNLTLNINAAGGITFATNNVNNTGTITNSGSGAGTLIISGGVGSNVTAITQNSTTSALTISTNALSVNSSGTTLTNAAGTKILTVSGGMTGTGDLILNNNSTLANGITLSTTAVNNTGTITNSGTGTGSVLISGGVGSNVTAVTGNSTTSALTVSGALTTNATATTLTNSSGTALLSLTGGVANTSGNLILNNNSSTAGGITVSGITVNNIGTITNSGTNSGTGTTVISAIIGASVTNIIQNSLTSQLTLSGVNTFTGGLTIKSGTVQANTSNKALGGATGTVTIGDTSGSANATLLIGTTGLTFSNPIVLATGNTGTLTISNTGTAISTTFSGGVTGTNNLIINCNATTGTITFSTASVNNSGTITNIGAGTGTATISGGVGSNVTAVTENSTTSALTVSTTALTVNSGGTTLTNVAGTKILTVSGGVTGTGNLVLNNNSTLASGITFSTNPINNIGTITNSGTGSGTLTISGGVGSNVTAVTENSTTSALTISGALTVNSDGTTLTNNNSSGSSLLTVSGGVNGTGNLVLNNNSAIYHGITLSTNLINNTGTITNSGTGSGSVLISGGVGSNVTAIIQNSTTSALTTIGTNVYVNASWAGMSFGADPDGAGPATDFGGDSFATIQDGVTGVSSGVTVNVAAGMYNENLIIDKQLTLLGPNAGVNPNTQTRNPEAIISKETVLGGQNLGLVNIVTGANNTIFDGFEVRTENQINTVRGIELNGADNVTIRNTKIHHTSDVLMYPNVNSNLLVENCEIYDATDFAVKPPSSLPSNLACTNVTIRGCTIHDVEGGIWVYRGSGWTIESNTIYNVDFGITLDHGGNHVARNNLIYAFKEAGINAEKTSTIVHNTIASTTAVDTSSYYGSGIAVKGAFTGGTIKDNIIVSSLKGIYFRTDYPPFPTVTIDYNDVWNNTYGNYVNGFTAGSHDISADPLFVNPADPDPWIGFSLQYSSPAYKTASDGTNIGAWQGDLTPPDTTAPVITLNGPSSITLYVGQSFVDPGATAVDTHDGNLTSAITSDWPSNNIFSSSGTTTITYSVHDTAGNAASTTRTVEVFPVSSNQVALTGTSITLSTTTPEVMFSSANTGTSTISVPLDVSNGTLNMSTLVSGASITIPAPLTINAITSIGAVTIQIPAGMTITASTSDSWSGIINLPQIKLNSLVSPTASAGTTASVSSVIEIGYGDVKLVFDKAVRILLPGQAGKYIGYSRSGTFTSIDSACSEDSQSAGDALLPEGDCKIDSGSDLVIWTKHFTQFVTYTVSTVSQNSSSDGGGGGGGNPGSVELTISNEANTNVIETGVTITWTTNYKSTSQVIYAAEGENHTLNLNDFHGNPPLYGYARTTAEYDEVPKVINHSVAITDLNPGTTYYYRTVSHGSLAVGEEHTFTTQGEKQQNIPPAIPPAETTGSEITEGNIAMGEETTPAPEIAPEITLQASNFFLAFVDKLDFVMRKLWQYGSSKIKLRQEIAFQPAMFVASVHRQNLLITPKVVEFILKPLWAMKINEPKTH